MRKGLNVLVVLLMTLFVAGVAFGGSSQESSESASSTTTTMAVSGEYSEAPELAEMVAAGKLPPVTERLPDNPFVVGPGVEVRSEDLDWSVGKYGGVLTSVTANPELDWNLRDAAMEGFLQSPAHTVSPIRGAIAETFEVNDDNTEFTLTIRKGIKWSDGTPVTTEDVRFAYEDVMMNEELTPTVSSKFRAGGVPGAEVMSLEIIDDFTFKMTFAAPYGRFLRFLGVGQVWGGQYDELMKPSHYMKQFHIKYTSKTDLQPALKEAGLGEDEWARLFHAKDIRWYENMRSNAVGYPTLETWMRVESPPELMVFERNPYYWKVDTAGQQLPYVGRYESVVVADPELIPVKVMGGEVNLNRDLIAHDKVALLKENEAKGGYRVDLDLVYHNAPIALFLNYNNEDPVWTEVVLERDFRHAINYAINRPAIIDAVFLGLGTYSNWFPGEYSPEKANKLLDEMGMDKLDSDGYRLTPSGERFEFFIEFKEAAADWTRMVELVRADLEAVKIRTPIKKIDNTLWTARRDALELYASVDWLDDVNWPFLVYDYMPNSRIGWGRSWHDWMNTNGAQGMEPPAWVKELYDIDDELRAVAPGSTAAEGTLKRFSDWMMEYVPVMPLARDVVGPVIVPPNLGNFAHQGKSSATWFAGEQFYFE